MTVLFADLVGFTSRAEELDPEDVDAILAPYHARLREELERHGGTVEKFIGDAVMAVFGAPQAHEDDPERAVRAALAIRDWALDQEDLEVRIAVNTGEALVNLDASSHEGEAMVAGDVVNTAARMQGAAPVNGVLVGEATYGSTDGIVDYREAAAFEAKGKAEPVRVWEAVTARSRFGVDAARWLRAAIPWYRYQDGDWGEAVRLADAFVAESEASPHYLEASTRLLRVHIACARGDVESALSDGARALERGREGGDPQVLYPGLVAHAEALLLAGRDDEARGLVEELYDRRTRQDEQAAFGAAAEGVLVLWRLLGPDRALEVARLNDPGSPLVEAAERLVRGDFRGAAEIYSSLENLPSVALCRLEAARAAAEAGRPAEAADDLAQALAFFRSVGATRYVREGEALLPASA